MTPPEIRDALQSLMDAIEVLNTTREICLLALSSPVVDFEDAVIVESAEQWSADCIVTRNSRDFIASPIEAIRPEELLERLDL